MRSSTTSLTKRDEHPRLERLPTGTNPDGFAVTLRQVASRRIAYIRVHRPYEGDHVNRHGGGIDVELRALDWLSLTWLPTSGYAPAHQPGFEAWNGRPFAHGMDDFEIRLQLPVVDARVPL